MQYRKQSIKHAHRKKKYIFLSSSDIKFFDIVISLNGRGWKGPLWVIWSNPPAEAGSPTTGCTGPLPGGS